MKEKRLLIIYILILSGFCLVLLEGKFDFYKEEPLKSSFEERLSANFSINSWFNGTYQLEQEQYLNANIGFRRTLIRLNNQLNYSLFNTAKANGVCVGKEGYLYEEGYINTYFGRDYIGEKAIKEFAYKTKFVQEKLKKRKIDFVVVFAPSKAAFFPEYIPEFMKGEETKKNNYSGFSSAFKNEGINTVDFYSWFLEMKEKCNYPLYPKTGIHWSAYGEILAGDSLLQYLKSLSGKNINTLEINSIEQSEILRATDRDIEKGMNLLYEIPNHKMAYPNYRLKNGTDFLQGMIVADSYYWGLYNQGFSKKYLNNGQFWYYNEEIFQSGKEKRVVDSVNVKNELEQHQVIVLITTDMNLHRFSFGFIDQLFELYNVSKEEEYADRVELYEKRIRRTADWLAKIETKAKEKNENLDSLITKNAKYMVWKDNQQP